MSSALCASSMYSRLKMSSFLFVRVWTMPLILYLSCGIPFPVKMPGIISGLTSVVVWLSWGEVIEKKILGYALKVFIHLSKGQMSKDGFVQEDFCRRRPWSKETIVQAESLKH